MKYFCRFMFSVIVFFTIIYLIMNGHAKDAYTIGGVLLTYLVFRGFPF